MKVSAEKLKTLVLCGLTIVMAWYLGSSQVIPQNTYRGMTALSLDSSLIIVLFYLFCFVCVYLLSDLKTPEGILCGLFLFYAAIFFLFFSSVSGYTDTYLVAVGGGLILAPLFFLVMCSRLLNINFGLRRFAKGFFRLRVEIVIAAVLIPTAVWMYQTMGASLSFIDSYDRRLLSREAVPTTLGYLFAMSLNGLSPLLAFFAVYNQKSWFLLVSIAFAFVGFVCVGSKAPILYVLLLAMLGFYLRRGGLQIVLVFVGMMAFVVFLAVIEFLVFDYSWIADIFVRRAIFVTPQVQMYTLDFLFSGQQTLNALIAGASGDTPVTYLVGEIYLGDEEANANTISFLTEIGRHGMIGYFLNIIFLLAIFRLLSHLYKVSNHGVWLAIATLYGLLLLEQSYATAFVTSGVGACIIIPCLFRYTKRF
jgi:hypothetical protein